MRLNPEQLLTFAVVVREGGIAAAARRLHVTQPAVSNQLKKLQDTIGEALYRRAGRGIELTGAGRHLYGHAQRMADSLADAEDLAEALRGANTGLVNIVASQTVGAYLLPPIVAAFRSHAPGIHLELASYNSREVMERLRGCDLALIEDQSAIALPQGMRAHPLMQDEIVAIMRTDHPLSANHWLDMHRLATEPLIWREPGSGTRAQVETAFRAAGIAPEIDVALAGVAAIKEAVRQGLGIGFSSRLALRHDSGALVGISLRPRLRRKLTLISGHHPSAAAGRFIEFLTQEVNSLRGRAAG